jgi:hypothetical protein
LIIRGVLIVIERAARGWFNASAANANNIKARDVGSGTEAFAAASVIPEPLPEAVWPKLDRH